MNKAVRSSQRSSKFSAFTLIELLIVVAIIAILAAIAVPNFLEAQTRSKVSRARADMRSLATALESYIVDQNAYPQGNPFNLSEANKTTTPVYPVLERLSSPVAYMTNGILPDPFRATHRTGVINASTGAATPVALTPAELQQEGSLKYAALVQQPSSNVLALVGSADRANQYWILWSVGPTAIKPQLAGSGILGSSATDVAVNAWIYDPTNGTVSNGGIFRVGGTPVSGENPGAVFFREVQKSLR